MGHGGLVLFPPPFLELRTYLEKNMRYPAPSRRVLPVTLALITRANPLYHLGFVSPRPPIHHPLRVLPAPAFRTLPLRSNLKALWFPYQPRSRKTRARTQPCARAREDARRGAGL